jgi:lipopolysaccharide export system protein LptC
MRRTESEPGNTLLSATSALEGTAGRHYVVGDRRDDARAFARAVRHSRRVRFLRIAIPAVIVLALGATWLVSWLDPLKMLVRLPIDSGKLVISGTKITMEAPKLSGYTRDNRWYELTASAAAQDITKPNMVELHDVRAKVETEDKSTMFLSAKDGLYDRKAGILTLNNDISLKSTSGYEVRLNEAVVDTGSGEIVSNKPVEVLSQQGTLKAERLEVSKSGEIVRFSGNVVMNVSGQGDGAVPAAEKQ